MEDGGELFVKEAADERKAGRPLAPAGGKELFLGSGMRCGFWVSKDGGEGCASGNAAVIGDAIDMPEIPEVRVRRLGLTAVPA